MSQLNWVRLEHFRFTPKQKSQQIWPEVRLVPMSDIDRLFNELVRSKH
jgi:hypothetical protein